MSFLAALAVLVVLLVFAFNNRYLGREVYGPKLGERVAHWAGVAIQVAFTGVMTFLWLNWLRGEHGRGFLLIMGLVWAVVAEAWEFFVARVQRKPWAEVLDEYNPNTNPAQNKYKNQN